MTERLRLKFSIRGLMVLVLLAGISIQNLVCQNKPAVSVVVDKNPGQPVLHGINALLGELTLKNVAYEKVNTLQEARGQEIIIAGLANPTSEASKIINSVKGELPSVPEALILKKCRVDGKEVWACCGFDDRGLMYGLLDIADHIRWNTNNKMPLGELKEISEHPDAKERGVSVYTMNRAYWESRFYDEKYWARYLDELAKNRFNSLIVIFGYENGGFLAPCYPYFFDVDEYSDVRMEGITAQEQQKNLAALNRLIAMAHERGINFSVGIWDHIYRGGVQRGGIPEDDARFNNQKPYLVRGVNNENLVGYNLKALEKFVRLVKGLDGIQFRMHDESGLKREEQDKFWQSVFQTMKGIAPGLRYDLRAKGLPESVVQSAIDARVNFRITTKYWMEQMGLPFHPTHINRENQFDRRHSYADMLSYPQRYKMLWRLWTGGTTRILLWGDPDYVRRFVESTHLYDGDGFEINEPLATKMEAQPHDEKPFELLNAPYRYYDYEFERYWYFFRVFGRLGYNPQTSPEVWQKDFDLRFGRKTGPLVQQALQSASQVLPRIVASCYPYGCFPTTRGWAEKQRLGDLPEYALGEGSDIQQFASFDEEAGLLLNGGETAKILPSANSVWFAQKSDEILQLLNQIEKSGGDEPNKELASTITDLRILSNLALYHSRRIPAAVSYRLYVRTKSRTALDDAIRYEQNAIEAWRRIVEAAGDVYNFDLKMGVREAEFVNIKHNQTGHWKDELNSLEQGLEKLVQVRNTLPQEATSQAPHYKAADLSGLNPDFRIVHTPVKSAGIYQPIEITANIGSLESIKWVRLRYRSVNQAEDYKVLPMVLTGTEGEYRATIPVDQIIPKFDLMYFLEIMDKNGHGRIYPDLNKEAPYIVVKLLR